MSTPFTVLIPARLASSRLPRKPLLDLGGQPMVVRCCERAARSGARRVVVACDDQAILQAVVRAGFEAVLTRADHATGTDRLAEAAALLGLPGEEIVVNLQGDEPLIAPGLLAQVAQRLAQRPDAVMCTVVHPLHSLGEWFNPAVVKVVLNGLGDAHWFSRAPLPWARDALAALGAGVTMAGDGAGVTATAAGAAGPAGTPGPAGVTAATSLHDALPAGITALRHVGLYAYRRHFLPVYAALPVPDCERSEALEQLRVLFHGERIACVQVDQAPPAGVDTPADLARVQALFDPAGELG